MSQLDERYQEIVDHRAHIRCRSHFDMVNKNREGQHPPLLRHEDTGQRVSRNEGAGHGANPARDAVVVHPISQRSVESRDRKSGSDGLKIALVTAVDVVENIDEYRVVEAVEDR